jgi:hypothetical protein
MSGTPWLMHGSDFDMIFAKPFPLQKLVDSVRNLTGAFNISEAAA